MVGSRVWMLLMCTMWGGSHTQSKVMEVVGTSNQAGSDLPHFLRAHMLQDLFTEYLKICNRALTPGSYVKWAFGLQINLSTSMWAGFYPTKEIW